MAKSSRKRVKPKPLGRKGKKKISPLNSEKIDYVDYKDVDLLKRFMSDRAKIRSRRVTGNDVQQHREVATAIKNAREMGLLAYTSRVTTQRRGGRRDDRRDDRKGRREGPEAEAPETKEVEGTDAEVTETVETPVEA